MRANCGRLFGGIRVPLFDPKFEDACGRREEDEGILQRDGKAGGNKSRECCQRAQVGSKGKNYDEEYAHP